MSGEIPANGLEQAFEERLAEAREVLRKGPRAAGDWLAEGDGETQLVKAAAITTEIARLGNKPGVVEGALHRIEDEETLADPELQRSLGEMVTGKLTEITPTD